MKLGRVLGSVVAEQKIAGLVGQKLLLFQPLNEKQEAVGVKQVAVDVVQAGPGDLVYWVGSREAAVALEDSFVPVDAAIVCLVDDVNI